MLVSTQSRPSHGKGSFLQKYLVTCDHCESYVNTPIRPPAEAPSSRSKTVTVTPVKRYIPRAGVFTVGYPRQDYSYDDDAEQQYWSQLVMIFHQAYLSKKEFSSRETSLNVWFWPNPAGQASIACCENSSADRDRPQPTQSRQSNWS
jgi:hypothetical protein